MNTRVTMLGRPTCEGDNFGTPECCRVWAAWINERPPVLRESLQCAQECAHAIAAICGHRVKELVVARKVLPGAA